MFDDKQGRQRCDRGKGIDPLGDVHGSPADAQCALFHMLLVLRVPRVQLTAPHSPDVYRGQRWLAA